VGAGDLGEPKIVCGPPRGTRASALIPAAIGLSIIVVFWLPVLVPWLLGAADTPSMETAFIVAAAIVTLFPIAFAAAAFRLWGRTLVAYEQALEIRIRRKRTLVRYSEIRACDLDRDESWHFPENSLAYPGLRMKPKRVRVRLRLRGRDDIELRSAGWDADGLEQIALYVRSRLRRLEPEGPPGRPAGA
jgi:hypothetical protein